MLLFWKFDWQHRQSAIFEKGQNCIKFSGNILCDLLKTTNSLSHGSQGKTANLAIMFSSPGRTWQHREFIKTCITQTNGPIDPHDGSLDSVRDGE